MDDRIVVKLPISHAPLILRQTPRGQGEWKNCRFYIDPPDGRCDFFVIYEEIRKEEKSICPGGNTLLFTAEPPTIKRYNPSYLKNFATVVTCNRSIRHPHAIYAQQCHPWWVGLDFTVHDSQGNPFVKMNYDDLKDSVPVKTRPISVVTSGKTHTRGHRLRFNFVKYLEKELGNEIVVFKPGNFVPDKWDAIAPFKYHVAIENCAYPHYWTEKLADTYLGGAYPFYYGCPNISEYFPADSLSIIDITDSSGATELIRKEMESGRYERSITQIREAKELVLDKYNLFAVIAELANAARKEENRITICFEPEKQINWSLGERTRYRWGQLMNAYNKL